MFAATLLADASWCPETGVGGYGYWIASDRGKAGGGAAFNNLLSSSNLAEMQAICNVVHIAKKQNLVVPGDIVLIQTDCTAAILGLKDKRPLNEDEIETYRKFCELTADLSIVFRHVKGHTKSYELKHRSNRACDARAKDAMREARRKARSPV